MKKKSGKLFFNCCEAKRAANNSIETVRPDNKDKYMTQIETGSMLDAAHFVSDIKFLVEDILNRDELGTYEYHQFQELWALSVFALMEWPYYMLPSEHPSSTW
jgi:hypothetical protein